MIHWSESNYTDEGYVVVADVLPEELQKRLAEDCDGWQSEDDSTSARAGRRNLLRRSSVVREIARSSSVRRVVEKILSPAAFAVRALWFDKRSGANWNVGWHQDLMIPVKRRQDLIGFTAWSKKEGVPHVMPPAEVLAGMVTVRLNLDANHADNGPLRVLPGSHRRGILESAAVRVCADKIEPRVCLTEAGGAVVMNPLVLHSSAKSIGVGRRRVLHLEYADFELPPPLEWYDRVAPVRCSERA